MKDKRKKNITRVVLSALILPLSPVMHLFAAESTIGYSRPRNFALWIPPVDNKELNTYK